MADTIAGMAAGMGEAQPLLLLAVEVIQAPPGPDPPRGGPPPLNLVPADLTGLLRGLENRINKGTRLLRELLPGPRRPQQRGLLEVSWSSQSVPNPLFPIKGERLRILEQCRPLYGLQMNRWSNNCPCLATVSSY